MPMPDQNSEIVATPVVSTVDVQTMVDPGAQADAEASTSAAGVAASSGTRLSPAGELAAGS